MDPINHAHWEQICANTVIQMIHYIEPFSTPISRVLSEDEGEHLGTGAYFQIEKNKYIITNEHVAEHLNRNSLTHQYFQSENVIRLTNPAFVELFPVDVAVSRIEDKNWEICDHGAQTIPHEIFAQKHSPVEHELLLFAGYSGERSRFLFGNLFSRGTPYLTQECDFPEGVNGADPFFHFGLHYKPDLAKSVDGSSFLPDPHGFSGSLVWDTKRLACLQAEKEWNPKMAEVTGIVWGWPSSSACILATKVEHLKLDSLTKRSV